MDRQHPILDLRSLRAAFEKSDTITLGRFEIRAIMEVIEPAMATGTQP